MVGKKLGSACLRNKHKRWAKEAFRKNRVDLKIAGCIIVRFTSEAQNYKQVEEEFLHAYQNAVEDRHRRP